MLTGQRGVHAAQLELIVLRARSCMVEERRIIHRCLRVIRCGLAGI